MRVARCRNIEGRLSSLPFSFLALRLGATGIGDRHRTLPVSATSRALLIVHTVECPNDEIVIVRMDVRATFDWAIAVQEIIEKAFATGRKDFVWKYAEMPEGPEQLNALR